MGRVVIIKEHLDEYPKETEDSGTGGLVLQAGENLFRLLAPCFQIQGVRAEINLISPGKLAERTDPNLLKSMMIAPQGENAFTNQVGKVHNSRHSIVKGQFQAITL
jgi:hypothetical protein